MELRHLRYFVAVAEERHFGRAAAKLRIAQPPLSRTIQQLERELGLLLFDRTKRTVELTAAGEALLVEARNVFQAVGTAADAARRAAAGKIGSIAIGYPSSLAYSGLTELVRAFRSEAPEVEVTVREMPPQAVVEALHAGTVDVGFVRAPIDDALLATEVFRSEPLVVALPSHHPLASRQRIALASLAPEPFVLFPRARGPAYFDYLMRLFHEAGFTPRIVQEAPQLDIVSLVAAGLGVSVVPSSLRHLRRSGLVLRPIAGNPRTELLVASRAAPPPPTVREFLSVVRRVAVRHAA